MSAAVRRCRGGVLCYHSQVQARKGLDRVRQQRRRTLLPAWLIPTHYYRASRCGRWHLGYEAAALPRPSPPDWITALTA